MNRTNDPGTSNFRSRILRPAGVLAGSMVLLVVGGVALVHFALRPEARDETALNVGLTAHGGRESANGLEVGAQSASQRPADPVPASVAQGSPLGVAEPGADDAGTLYMLGMSQWKSGHAEQAEASLVQALDRDPRHVKSLVNLARVRLELGDAQKALVPIGRAVELAPDDAEAHRVHGRVLHSLGVGAQAELAYARALTLDPQDGWALNNLGLLWIEAGEFTMALGPLARAVQVEPAEARIWNNLGVALERAERYGAATEAYTKALEADSTFARAHVSLIRVRPHVAAQSWPNPDLTQIASDFDPSKPLLAAIRGTDEQSTDESAAGVDETGEPVEASEVLDNAGEPLSVAPIVSVNVTSANNEQE